VGASRASRSIVLGHTHHARRVPPRSHHPGARTRQRRSLRRRPARKPPHSQWFAIGDQGNGGLGAGGATRQSWRQHPDDNAAVAVPAVGDRWQPRREGGHSRAMRDKPLAWNKRSAASHMRSCMGRRLRTLRIESCSHAASERQKFTFFLPIRLGARVAPRRGGAAAGTAGTGSVAEVAGPLPSSARFSALNRNAAAPLAILSPPLCVPCSGAPSQGIPAASPLCSMRATLHAAMAACADAAGAASTDSLAREQGAGLPSCLPSCARSGHARSGALVPAPMPSCVHTRILDLLLASTRACGDAQLRARPLP